MNNYISIDIPKRNLKSIGKKIILEQLQEFDNLVKYQIFGKYLYLTSMHTISKISVIKYKLYNSIACDPIKEIIYEKIKSIIPENNRSNTFAVSVERKGEHRFTSTELAREMAGSVFDLYPNIKVNLDNPELKINIKIYNNKCFLYSEKK